MYTVKRIRTGRKVRRIEVPNPDLKKAQKELMPKLRQIVIRCSPGYGCLPGRGTGKCLKSLMERIPSDWKKLLVVKMDLMDFFHNVTASMVVTSIKKMYLRKQIEDVFGSKDEMDAFLDYLLECCFIGTVLPQGAPTSPLLAEIVAGTRIDPVAINHADLLSFVYTRYVDDMIFVAHPQNGDAKELIRCVMGGVRFTINKKKIAVLSRRRAQRVLGTVLNSGEPTISRRKVRDRLKAAIHQEIRNGRDPLKNPRIRGYVSWMKDVAPKSYEWVMGYIRKKGGQK